MPGREVLGQAERADLLGRVLLGEQPVQVVAGPADGGHAHVEPEHGLTGFHHPEQQRQPGKDEQRDQPGLDRQQGDDDAGDGGDRTDGADQPVDHLDRPVLAGSGSHEPIVERRRLVRGQLDPGGDIDDGLLGVPCGGLRQDLAHLPAGRGDQAERGDDAYHRGELRGDRADPGRVGRRTGVGGQHRVDQVAAEDQRGGQTRTVDQLQRDAGDQHPGVGGPDETNRVGGDPRQQLERLGPLGRLLLDLLTGRRGRRGRRSRFTVGGWFEGGHCCLPGSIARVNRQAGGRRCRRRVRRTSTQPARANDVHGHLRRYSTPRRPPVGRHA